MASEDRQNTNPKPSGKKEKELSQEEQSERLKKITQELGADENDEKFKRVLSKLKSSNHH